MNDLFWGEKDRCYRSSVSVLYCTPRCAALHAGAIHEASLPRCVSNDRIPHYIELQLPVDIPLLIVD